jgi:uncharacterized protein (TIGR02246 family)
MRRIFLSATLGLMGLAWALGQSPTPDEEKAVRAAIESYTAAFNKGDLESLRAHFAADADFIDENGKKFTGGSTLADLCKQSLRELKGFTLRTAITSLRMVRPDVAIADGRADLIGPDGTTDSGRFTSIWTKTGDKWLLNSVRDLPESPANEEAGPGQLNQLEWVIGDWIHEQAGFTVRINARWALKRSFLLLEYTVKGKDGDDLTVTQYFGWDPLDRVIRSWFFDSQAGYGRGDWERQGNTWTAYLQGAISEGRSASSTNSITLLDDKTFVFRSVDREIDGLPVADVEAKFVRKSTGN